MIKSILLIIIIVYSTRHYVYRNSYFFSYDLHYFINPVSSPVDVFSTKLLELVEHRSNRD